MDTSKFQVSSRQQHYKSPERSPRAGTPACKPVCLLGMHSLSFCFPCGLAKSIMPYRCRSPAFPRDCMCVQSEAFKYFDGRHMPNVIHTVVLRLESHTRGKTVKRDKYYTNVLLLLLLFSCPLQVTDCCPGSVEIPEPRAARPTPWAVTSRFVLALDGQKYISFSSFQYQEGTLENVLCVWEFSSD